MKNSERLQKIITDCYEHGNNQPENTFEYDLYYFAKNKFGMLNQSEKIARSMAAALTNQKIYIYPYDKIIGRVYHLNSKKPKDTDSDILYADLWNRTKTDAGKKVFEKYPYYREYIDNQLVSFGSAGHIAWDWNRMLKTGTSGMKELCSEYLSKAEDEKQREFYNGVLIMLTALEDWNDMHIEELERMGMHDMAEICRKVPRYPAESFHEAMQAYFMQYIAVMRENPFGGNSPGRLDYYLWPYLEKDLNEGKCTLEEAKELIAELFARLDERISPLDTWVESIVVGGSNPDGSSAVNPLSYIMIEVFMELNLTHPAVYVRIPENAPEDFIKLCSRYMLCGNNRAQLLSDKNITNALMNSGVPYNDAVDYFCGGCMEIGIQGKTSDFLYNGYINIVKMVELAVTGGFCLKNKVSINGLNFKGLKSFSNFEDFYADFLAEANRLLGISFNALEMFSIADEEARPSFLISSMIDNCMQTGRNMNNGGAKYYDYGYTPIGLPNAADYLFSVKKAVFDDKICTADELISALAANFDGYEELRKKLLNIPKYGQENKEADNMAKRLFTDICNIFSSYTNRFGGKGKVIILTFIWAPDAGKILGATAYGGLAGKNIAQGITPQGAFMNRGITSAINSCTSIPSDIYDGGASTMWDFDSKWINEDIITVLFKSFFDKGGQIFQGNTTDVESLIKAQKSPEEYQSLIVRVGGYSARFTSLTKELQDDIINRVRHKQ